jgi:hypothetical protein
VLPRQLVIEAVIAADVLLHERDQFVLIGGTKVGSASGASGVEGSSLDITSPSRSA